MLRSLHCYEITRGGLFASRIRVLYDFSYLSFVLAVLTPLGQQLMRDLRRYIDFA